MKLREAEEKIGELQESEKGLKEELRRAQETIDSYPIYQNIAERLSEVSKAVNDGNNALRSELSKVVNDGNGVIRTDLKERLDAVDVVHENVNESLRTISQAVKTDLP